MEGGMSEMQTELLQVSLDSEMCTRWRTVARDEILKGDKEIVHYLLELYDLTRNGVHPTIRCVRCCTPLVLYCPECQQPVQQYPHMQYADSTPQSPFSNHGGTTPSSDQPKTTPMFLNPLVHAATGTVNSTGGCLHKGVKEPSRIMEEDERLISTDTQESEAHVESVQQQSVSACNSAADENVISECGVSGASKAQCDGQQAAAARQQETAAHRNENNKHNVIPSKESFSELLAASDMDLSNVNPHMHAATGTVNSSGGCTHMGVNLNSSPAELALQSAAPDAASQNVDSTSLQTVEAEDDEDDDGDISSADENSSVGCLDSAAFAATGTVNSTSGCMHQGVGGAASLRNQRKLLSEEPCMLQETMLTGDVEETSRPRQTFMCAVCSDRFSKSSFLKQHEQIHNSDNPYMCDTCHVGYTQALHLKQHMGCHNREKEHVCKVCKRAFRLLSTLVTHLRSHAHVQHEKCRLCGKVFKKVNDLTEHMSRTHKGSKAYVCDDCGFEFDRRCDLNKHARVHTGYKSHVCSVCSAGFGDKSMLTQHMRTHTGDRPYSCELCHKTFTTRCSIMRHKRMIHKQKKLTVTKRLTPLRMQSPVLFTVPVTACARGLKKQGCIGSRHDAEKETVSQQEIDVTKHGVSRKLSHTDEKISRNKSTASESSEKGFLCRVCARSFSTVKDLRQHKQSHIDKKRYSCKLCDAVFRRPIDVKMHMTNHRAPKTYKCNICGKVFQNYKEYKNHPQTHAVNRRYVCKICEARCGCPSALKTHMRTHTGEKPFVCDLCSKSFAYAAGLRAHMEGHKDHKSHMCHVCGMGFTRAGSLNSHMRTHTGHRPYKCQECDASFAQGTTLKRHMYTHTGERPYVCDLCSKTYTTPGALTRHKLAHDNARGYVCNVCGMAFNTSIVLKQHMKGRHSSEKPFKCTFCDYASALKGHLTLHMAIHSDSKPFVCQVCGCAFKKARGLKKHEKIHTRDKPHACDICGASFDRQAHLTIHKKFHEQAP